MSFEMQFLFFQLLHFITDKFPLSWSLLCLLLLLVFQLCQICLSSSCCWNLQLLVSNINVKNTLGSFSSDLVKSLCFVTAACLFNADSPMLPMSISFRHSLLRALFLSLTDVNHRANCSSSNQWTLNMYCPGIFISLKSHYDFENKQIWLPQITHKYNNADTIDRK